MPRLTILRGVSGSGKSTWARQQNAVVVSRDDMRLALYGSDGKDYYAVDKDVLRERENVITLVCEAAIAGALKAGKDVVVDNTNVEWKFVKQLAKLGFRHGADVGVRVFDVPMYDAILRDENRHKSGGRYVGADIIRSQYERLQKTKNLMLESPNIPQAYYGTPGKPKAFMVDIDGTLAHMRDYRGPFEWHNVHLDEPDETIVDIVNVLGSSNLALDLGYYKVIVMSGRDESCRELTENWLNDYITYDHLFMRPEKDMRPDNLVKAELFDKYVRDNFDVQFVLDDRDQVVDMWRRMGLKCLQVDFGDF